MLEHSQKELKLMLQMLTLGLSRAIDGDADDGDGDSTAKGGKELVCFGITKDY